MVRLRPGVGDGLSGRASLRAMARGSRRGISPGAGLVGVLSVNKPGGVTSRDVVNQVGRVLGRGVKLGHAGTLDPLATGVLVLCVGQATRLIEYVQDMPKAYRAVIRLGATSDTLDADGQVTERIDPPVPTIEAVRSSLATQVGLIDQMPPVYSALKVGGQRAYDLARAGQEVDLKPRPVRIDRIELVDYEWPLLTIDVDCGSGTYIRSIARDAGEILGCGGLIQVLTRTRIGGFRIGDSPSPDALDSIEAIVAHLRPAREAVATLPAIPIDIAAVEALRNGKSLPLRESDIAPEVASGEVGLIGPDGGLAAIANVDRSAGFLRPCRVFCVAESAG